MMPLQKKQTDEMQGKDKGVDHDTDSKDDEKLISASVGDRAKDNAPAKFKAKDTNKAFASASDSLIKKEHFGRMHRNTGYFRDSNELPLHLPTTELKVKIIMEHFYNHLERHHHKYKQQDTTIVIVMVKVL